MVNYEVVVEEQECSRPDGSRMALRITRPRGEGPFPAVVDIHGGGWITGTRSDNAIIDNHLARNGIVAVAPEFRMPPLARYPVAIADIMLSVCWLKANARALGSRPDAGEVR